MMLTNFFPIVAVMVMGLIIGKTVTPSTLEKVKTTKIQEQTIPTEKSLYDAIQRYINIEKTLPTTMADLNTKGYFLTSNNNNGFGGGYSFTIDSSKGTVKISKDIPDANVRLSLINSYKNTFKPVQGTGNNVDTTFVLPTSTLHGTKEFDKDIPTSNIAPSASTNKYWYDTSGTEAILKLSDGTTWKTIAGGSASSGGTNVTNASTSLGTIALKSTLRNVGTDGEIKYVYDSVSNALQQYTYYNNQWFLLNSTLGSYSKFVDVSVLQNLICYIKTGDVKTYCVGYGKYGNNGTSTNTITPTALNTSVIFSKLIESSGFSTNCGIEATTNYGYCWGGYSAVGDGTSGKRVVTTPKKILPTNMTWNIIAPGYEHSCAISTAQDAYCWGEVGGGYGALGLGTTASAITPTLVIGGLKWQSIGVNYGSASTFFSCGITTTGDGYCWGSDGSASGALGNGSTTTVLSPTKVTMPIGKLFKKVVVGAEHVCAITTTNEIYCWGSNNMGSLGDGTNIKRLIPTLVVNGIQFKDLTASDYFSCGLDINGYAYCWGNNNTGQLGIGSTTNTTNKPTLVSDSIQFVKIKAGSSNVCGISTTDQLYCWGSNDNKQINNTTTTMFKTPVKVY